MITEEIQRLEKVLGELRGFIGTFVHTEFVASTAKDLQAVETRILEDDITSIPDLFTLIELRAQRRVLKSNLLSFEDTVANLENRITLLKRNESNLNAAQQKLENEDENQETNDDV